MSGMFVDFSGAEPSSWHEWALVLLSLGIWVVGVWHLVSKPWSKITRFIQVMLYTAVYVAFFFTSGSGHHDLAMVFLIAFGAMSLAVIKPPK